MARGLIAAEVAIRARRKLRGWNFVADLKTLRVAFAVRVSGFQRQFVGFGKQRLLAELVVDPSGRSDPSSGLYSQ